MTEISTENNKAEKKLNQKLSGIKNDRGIIARFLLSPASKISNTEDTSQPKVVKVPNSTNSNRVKDLLINETIPNTLFNQLLIIIYTDKKLEINRFFFSKFWQIKG